MTSHCTRLAVLVVLALALGTAPMAQPLPSAPPLPSATFPLRAPPTRSPIKAI